MESKFGKLNFDMVYHPSFWRIEFVFGTEDSIDFLVDSRGFELQLLTAYPEEQEDLITFHDPLSLQLWVNSRKILAEC